MVMDVKKCNYCRKSGSLKLVAVFVLKMGLIFKYLVLYLLLYLLKILHTNIMLITL